VHTCDTLSIVGEDLCVIRNENKEAKKSDLQSGCVHIDTSEYEYGSGFPFMSCRSFTRTSGTFSVTCTNTQLNVCQPY